MVCDEPHAALASFIFIAQEEENPTWVMGDGEGPVNEPSCKI